MDSVSYFSEMIPCCDNYRNSGNREYRVGFFAKGAFFMWPRGVLDCLGDIRILRGLALRRNKVCRRSKRNRAF